MAEGCAKTKPAYVISKVCKRVKLSHVVLGKTSLQPSEGVAAGSSGEASQSDGHRKRQEQGINGNTGTSGIVAAGSAFDDSRMWLVGWLVVAAWHGHGW
jgi:hypothetical protein